MVNVLIEEGMSAEQKSNEWSALHWAAHQG